MAMDSQKGALLGFSALLLAACNTAAPANLESAETQQPAREAQSAPEGDVNLWPAVESHLIDPAIEALDHAVCLG